MVRRRRERAAEEPENEDLWDIRALSASAEGRRSDSDLVCYTLTAGLAELSHRDTDGRSKACAMRRKDIWMFLALLDCIVVFKEDSEVYEIWTALDQAGQAGRRLYAERLRLAGQVLRGLLQAASCLAHVDGFDRGVEEDYDRLGKAIRRFEARLKHVANAVKTLDGSAEAEHPKGRRAQRELEEVPEPLEPPPPSDRGQLRLDLLSTAGRMLTPLCEIPRSIGSCIICDCADENPQGRRARATARRAALREQESSGSGSLFGNYVVGATNYLYCIAIGHSIS